MSFAKGAKLLWWRWKMVNARSMLKFEWQKSREFIAFATEPAEILEALRYVKS